MKNFIQTGNNITVLALAATASGDGVLMGSMFGVANGAAAIGEKLTLTLTGVFEFTKVSSQAWTVGQKVYWDNTNSRMSTTATGNALVGVVVLAAANPTDVGTVRLDGVAR